MATKNYSEEEIAQRRILLKQLLEQRYEYKYPYFKAYLMVILGSTIGVCWSMAILNKNWISFWIGLILMFVMRDIAYN